MGILMGKEFCLTDLYIKYWDEQCVAVGLAVPWHPLFKKAVNNFFTGAFSGGVYKSIGYKHGTIVKPH